MRRHLHHYATLLALCAVLLRGVIPLGWMPSAETGTLALCTANGLVQLAPAQAAGLLDGPAAPADGHEAQSTPCSFAASGTPGAVPAPFALSQPAAGALAPPEAYSTPFLAVRPAGTALARAPPLVS